MKSIRCDELYTLRMQNDQKVLQCLKNPPETVRNNSGVTVPCQPGTGTGVCAVSGLLQTGIRVWKEVETTCPGGTGASGILTMAGILSAVVSIPLAVAVMVQRTCGW